MAYVTSDLVGLRPHVYRGRAVPHQMFIGIGPISFALSEAEMRHLIAEAQALLVDEHAISGEVVA